MIPVTLAKMDNYSGFLGTFDGINWWKTEPLPGGAIDYVNDAVWVYGQYHVCSAKLMDGSYSIYQSRDNGFSWRTVVQTWEKINTIICPDYGIALAATSGGWWRSTNSGSVWERISTQAPNCFCVKELTNDILVALSLHDIWKSDNGGITWTSTFHTTENIIYPAIDGTYYDCIVGIGTNLYVSNFPYSPSWVLVPPSNDVYAGYPQNGTPAFPPLGDTAIYTDIELTSTFGAGDYYGLNTIPTWVVQKKYPNGTLRHYHVRRCQGRTAVGFCAYAKFDSKSSIYNSLSSDESQVTGSTDINRAVIFSGSENGFPILKKSTDGGANWTTIELRNANIYTGPDLSQLSSRASSFIEDTYFDATWYHTALCHNTWKISHLGYVRNQSFDIDFMTVPVKVRTQEYYFDVLNRVTKSQGYAMKFSTPVTRRCACLTDTLIRDMEMMSYTSNCSFLISIDKPTVMDILNQITLHGPYLMDIMTKAVHNLGKHFKMASEKTVDIDLLLGIVIVHRRYRGLETDIQIQKDVALELEEDILIEDSNDKVYEVGMSVRESVIPKILHNTEQFHEQPWAIGIGYPREGYDVFDSRKTTKV
jgi:hypothetical protein